MPRAVDGTPDRDWVRRVMQTSFATFPPQGVFTRGPEEIATAGDEPGVAPAGLTSWQRMVLFHHNRGGRGLTEERRQALRQAVALLSQRRLERRQRPDLYDPQTLLPLAGDRFTEKQAAAAAIGLPNPADYGDLSRVQPGQLLDWVVQRHEARRAGLHHDVRLGGKDTGLYSWAVRKGLPQPGQKHLAVQQPLHAHSYKGFEGEIPAGYGAGRVSKHDEGQVLVTRAGPEGIHFSTAHRRFPERYALIPYRGRNQNERQWLLLNTTKTEAIPYEKKRYAKVPADKAESVLANLTPGSTVQAKLDGAASLTKLFKDHAEVVSYRARKDTGGPIVHTERVAGGRLPVQIPRGLEGTVLRGELYGVGPQGKAIPPQELGGLLNSSVGKSLTAQRERGIRLRNMLFDVERMGQDPVTEPSYQARRAKLQQVLQHLPSEYFHTPDDATTPAQARALWDTIRTGQHPLTREGVVIHPPTGIPQKVKLTEDHDVHVRGFFPGQGKYLNRGVGGFTYSHTPMGPVVGEVGTGLTDETRRMMHEDPQSFVGRVARVRAQEKLPSGALRAPSFLSLHEDLPLAKEALDAARKVLSSMGLKSAACYSPLEQNAVTSGNLSAYNYQWGCVEGHTGEGVDPRIPASSALSTLDKHFSLNPDCQSRSMTDPVAVVPWKAAAHALRDCGYTLTYAGVPDEGLDNQVARDDAVKTARVAQPAVKGTTYEGRDTSFEGTTGDGVGQPTTVSSAPLIELAGQPTEPYLSAVRPPVTRSGEPERRTVRPPSVLLRLLQAKAHSDRRAYAAKHALLRDLLRERPHEFVIDSQKKDVIGLTHQPTGFRIHLPRRALPTLAEPLSVLEGASA